MNLLIPFLIGSLGGLIAALCGVGGGIVMVPAFVYFLGRQFDQQQAIATSLAVIVPTALVATAKNARNGLVDWRIFLITAAGAVLVAFFAADWMKSMSNLVLTRIFAVVLIASGVRMLFTKV